MSNLINFNFENHPVRVELKDGEPLFCLTDVATILDIGNANPSRFNLSDDGIHKMYSVDSKGRKNEITFINEPNLYRVIFRSNKKEAVKFQNWVFNEVLPSIRKTGSYEVAPAYPMVNIVNPPMPNGGEMYKTFIATVNMQGVMTMRELKKDEFVSTYEDLPGLLRYRSWYVPNEKMAKIAKATLNKITGEWE